MLAVVVALMIAWPAPDAAVPVATSTAAAAAAAPPAPPPPAAADPAPLATAPAFDSRQVAAAGLVAYTRGDITGSVEQFQAVVEADPQNAEALNNLGQVLVRSGRPREAIPYFDRAIAQAGGVWAYHFNRARALGQLQQWSAAVAGYRAAARLFPDDYVTEFNLAKALDAAGDLPAAITGYERAIALAPSEADFHLAHASALERAARPADAAAAYERYLELLEDAPNAEKIRARIAQLTER